MQQQPLIRTPGYTDIDALTSLAMKSKSYWEYDYTYLRNCVETFLASKNHIRNQKIYLVEEKNRIMGFYALQGIDEQHIELIFLYIDPVSFGNGIGKILFEHAKRQARISGYKYIIVQSDPFAIAFYQKLGCHLVRKNQFGAHAGSELPLLKYKL